MGRPGEGGSGSGLHGIVGPPEPTSVAPSELPRSHDPVPPSAGAPLPWAALGARSLLARLQIRAATATRCGSAFGDRRRAYGVRLHLVALGVVLRGALRH